MSVPRFGFRRAASTAAVDAAALLRDFATPSSPLFVQRAAAILGKSEEGIDKLAADLAASKTVPVRPDRRFPNTNQAANCWYVSALLWHIFRGCVNAAQSQYEFLAL